MLPGRISLKSHTNSPRTIILFSPWTLPVLTNTILSCAAYPNTPNQIIPITSSPSATCHSQCIFPSPSQPNPNNSRSSLGCFRSQSNQTYSGDSTPQRQKSKIQLHSQIHHSQNTRKKPYFISPPPKTRYFGPPQIPHYTPDSRCHLHHHQLSTPLLHSLPWATQTSTSWISRSSGQQRRLWTTLSCSMRC